MNQQKLPKTISDYLSQIGSKGGKKSKRLLPSSTAKSMVNIRLAKAAYKKYFNQCFWSFDPNYKIGKDDIQWVAEQLKKNGDRKLWELGSRLCR